LTIQNIAHSPSRASTPRRCFSAKAGVEVSAQGAPLGAVVEMPEPQQKPVPAW
jgi:hypothetical protein